MIFKVILQALLRKANAFLSEVSKLATETREEGKRIEAAAKAEVLKLRDELVTKISNL